MEVAADFGDGQVPVADQLDQSSHPLRAQERDVGHDEAVESHLAAQQIGHDFG